jgi:hypothetical protein
MMLHLKLDNVLLVINFILEITKYMHIYIFGTLEPYSIESEVLMCAMCNYGFEVNSC